MAQPSQETRQRAEALPLPLRPLDPTHPATSPFLSLSGKGGKTDIITPGRRKLQNAGLAWVFPPEIPLQGQAILSTTIIPTRSARLGFWPPMNGRSLPTAVTHLLAAS